MKYIQNVKKVINIKLDAKDKKILSLLAENSRISATNISKKVGLSRDAVQYRIKNYEKRGLIQGYRTIVDISKFGYAKYHLFINLNTPTPEVENKILEKLKKYPFIRAIIDFGGSYDLEIAIIAKDINHLDDILTKIINACGDHIKGYDILTIVKEYVSKVFPSSLLHYKEILQSEKDSQKIDKKDIEILKNIGENAKIPLAELGEDINLSADTISYRIKKLKESGVIKKFIPVINHADLGYSLYSLLLDIGPLDDKKEKLLQDFLRNDPNVLWAVKTIGKFNLLIYVLVKSVQELQNTSVRLRELFVNKINNYETLVAFEEFVYVYFPKNLF